MATSPFSLARFRAALRHFVLGRLAQAGSTLALTLIAIRVLDERHYGTYMVVWGLVELAVPLTSLGLLPAAQRFLPELASHGSRAQLGRLVALLAGSRLALVVGACLGLAVFWQPMSGWFQLADVDAGDAVVIAALVGCNVLMRFAAEMLESLLEQRYAQTVRALLPIARLVAVLGLWLAGAASLTNLLRVEMACSVALWLVAEWWLRRRVRLLQPEGGRTLGRAEFWTFVWHMSGVQLLNATANVGLLRMIVARALGVEAAGHFAFLQQLVLIAQRYLPSTLLANLIRPMLIARHAAAQHRDVEVAFGLLWKVNLMLVWPLLPAAWLAGSAAVATLSGHRVDDAGIPLALLTLALAATAQNQIVVMAMQVYRYTALARGISVFAVGAPLLVWFGTRYGLAGAAGGLAAALVLRGSAGLWALRRQPLGAALDWTGVWRFSAVLAAATLAGIAARPFAGDLAAGALLLAAVVLGTRVLPPLHRDEMGLIERALGRRAHLVAGWARR